MGRVPLKVSCCLGCLINRPTAKLFSTQPVGADPILTTCADLTLLKDLAPSLPALLGWYALIGPAKMGTKITQKLALAVNQFLMDPSMKQKLIDQFLFPIPGSSADIQKRAENEARIWGTFIGDLKIQID